MKLNHIVYTLQIFELSFCLLFFGHLNDVKILLKLYLCGSRAWKLYFDWRNLLFLHSEAVFNLQNIVLLLIKSSHFESCNILPEKQFLYSKLHDSHLFKCNEIMLCAKKIEREKSLWHNSKAQMLNNGSTIEVGSLHDH